MCVSVAPLGKYRNTARASSYGWNAYHTVFQEAQEWLREGICDVLFPMLYYDAHHFFPFVDDWSEQSYGRHFVAGLGAYQLAPEELNWDINVILRQIHFVRAFEGAEEGTCYGDGASGYALFRARFIMQNTKGIRDALHYLNQYPALVPALAWEKKGRPDSPSSVSFSCVGDSIRIQWMARGGQGIRYNLYRAIGSKAVDITDGCHLYLTYQEGTTITVPRATRTLDAAYALTAIDRYGNESRPVMWTIPAVKPISPPLSVRR